MVYKEEQASVVGVKPELALRLYASQSSEVQRSLEALYKRYGKYAVAAKELRAVLDKALGERTLTEELYQIQE